MPRHGDNPSRQGDGSSRPPRQFLDNRSGDRPLPEKTVSRGREIPAGSDQVRTLETTPVKDFDVLLSAMKTDTLNAISLEASPLRTEEKTVGNLRRELATSLQDYSRFHIELVTGSATDLQDTIRQHRIVSIALFQSTQDGCQAIHLDRGRLDGFRSYVNNEAPAAGLQLDMLYLSQKDFQGQGGQCTWLQIRYSRSD